MKFLLLIGFVFVVSLTHAEDTDVEQPEASLIPVAFEGGNAGATSYWSEDYKPAAAFSMSAPIGWHTAKGKAGEVKPQVIFYQFKTALKVAKVAFQPRKDCRGSPLEKTPKKFQIVASNDAKCNVKSKWVVLVQKERGKLKDCNDVDVTIIPDAKQNMYTCYGINILSTISDSTQTHKHTALSRIKMWRQDTITGAVSCSKSAQLDLQIIVDSSGSVGIKHFQQMMKDIADKVLSSFVIGPKHTRVALFKYSNLMVNEFDLDKFSDIKSLKTATAAVKYTGGGTKTGTAMKEALGHFTKKMRKDAKTAKVCIVFTDGESMDAKIIPGVTKEWAKAGVTVFAVGIGKGISKKGLVAVAGDAQHALQVNDFSELATSAKTLLVEVCKTIVKKIVKKIPKPTCFSYPAAKNVAYTSLKPLRSMDLGALTVDIYATLTQSTGDPCYVSYAIPGQNNELVLGSKGYVHINGALPIRRHTSIPALKRKVRYTVTWDGTSGVTVLYIDGKESARGTHKGKLRAGGSFVLGQEQDSVGGGFVSSQRFIGYLCDLQMWARVLSTAERQALFSGRAVSRGDVFDLPPTYTHALHAGALMV